MSKIVIGLAIAGCVSLSACISYEMTYKPGGAIPDPATSYAIVHLETPSADLSKIICEAFLARGMAASIVADAGSAMQAQAIVRYETSWMWDRGSASGCR
jgi:hypothetical protein